MNLTEVVIPAAGLGTRFFPFTKAVAKEMLPLLNIPALEYIIKEIVESNIRDVFVIINKDKELILNYFDNNLNFENKINFTYIQQQHQLGLGHAVLMSKDYIKNDFFSVVLPDDIILSQESTLTHLTKLALEKDATIIAVQEIEKELIPSYGIIKIDNQLTDNLFQVSDIIEKPETSKAPSNYAVIGRYVLSKKIFEFLSNTKLGTNNEIQLTDAISNLIKDGRQKVFAYKINAQRFDIGNPLGWLEANIKFAMNNPLYSSKIKKLLEI